jgi:hypothetical protein
MRIQKQIETLKEKLFDINVYSLEYVSLLDEIIVLQYQLNSDEFDCNYYYLCSGEAKHKARCLADDCYNEAFGQESFYNYYGIAKYNNMKKQLAKLLKSYHKKWDCFGNKKRKK